MTETALDIITKALKRIGVISGIETPSADLAADGLDRLNGLIETWSTESLALWTQSQIDSVTPLQAGKSSYTVGPLGDVPVPIRPSWIDGVSLILSGSPDFEYQLTAMSRQHWESETQKAITSAQPTAYYYSPSWPLGTLSFWPVYNGGGTILKQRFYLPVPFVGPALLTTVLDYPPGYSRALRDWLAIELAPEVGRQVDAPLFQSATDAKAQLQRVNFQPRELSMPAGLGCGGTARATGAYDWRVDE